MWVCSAGLVGLFISLHARNDVAILDSGETYEMRNNLVVRPFRTDHAIPSQVGRLGFVICILPDFEIDYSF